ncbi:MAG: twin-arginine translocase TatA/TatE family subunit [Alphaproteobacteria bacterium]
MSFGIWQIVLIVLVVVLVFGANKIPRVMGDFAKGIKSFKAGLKEGETADTAQASPANQPSENAQEDSKAINAETTAADAGSVKKDEAAKG